MADPIKYTELYQQNPLSQLQPDDLIAVTRDPDGAAASGAIKTVDAFAPIVVIPSGDQLGAQDVVNIRAAITAAVTGNPGSYVIPTIQLQGNRFYINDTIDMAEGGDFTRAPVLLRGSDTTSIRWVGPALGAGEQAPYMFRYAPAHIRRNRHALIKDVYLECQDKARGVHFAYCWYYTLMENVYIYGSRQTGFDATQCWGANIVNSTVSAARGFCCRMSDWNNGYTEGLQLLGVGDGITEDEWPSPTDTTTIMYPSGTFTTPAVERAAWHQTGRGCLFHASTFENCNYGALPLLYTRPTGTNSSSRNVWDGVWLESSISTDHRIYIDGSVGTLNAIEFARWDGTAGGGPASCSTFIKVKGTTRGITIRDSWLYGLSTNIIECESGTHTDIRLINCMTESSTIAPDDEIGGAVTGTRAVIVPGTVADASAVNGAIYHSSDREAVAFKNADGNIQTLPIMPSGDATGATDATNINAAIAASTDVKLEAGQFYVNSTISIDELSVTLSGAGDATVINGVGSIPIITVKPSVAGTRMSCIISDLQTVGGTNGLLLDGAPDVTCTRCAFEYASSHGVFVTNGGWWHTFSKCSIRNNTGDGINALSDASDQNGNAMHLDGCQVSINGANGINWRATGLNCSGCSFEANTSAGVLLSCSAAASAFNASLVGCYFESNGNSQLHMVGVTGKALVGVFIAGSYFYDSDANPAIYASGDWGTVQQVTFDRSNYILTTGGAKYINVGTVVRRSTFWTMTTASNYSINDLYNLVFAYDDIGPGVHRRSTLNVSNPPTDAELDAEFGTPAQVGNGYTVYIDDNGAGATFYQCVSDGTNWWVFTGTKAT